ncbi:HhH-GPD-type base excision DNA repair protein [Cellulosimicrobium cellulans]|uniref:HhH-GPD-type base excision DNA repair protein n=1 Tax=Cellulosimicrobium cellulans TaxID=1710 RepID=UPI0024076988|nr:HhH-GPD-type base excision DNA repair protein [Cellulosimicrobium cellulans]MDF9878127.1 putative HhH-GPD family protein [Cellulosimicrobium cellulans]
MTDQLWITGDPDADALLSDDAFALLVGMLLDQQYPMEHAFAGPRKIRDRLGSIDPRAVAEADPDAFVTLATTPPAIHRYGRSMAARVQDLARVVVDEYDGDATRIWTAPGADGAPTGREVLARLRALPGFGDQKARIFLALLGKQRGVQPAGWREAAGHYGDEGSRRSIADVTSPESLAEVRTFKKAQKAAAKAAKA